MRSVVVAVVVAMAFAACSRERTTIIGSYGDGVVTGRVVMADGSSPAGVEVAVEGTGMRVVLGEEGSFAFGNMPDDAKLLFHRDSMIASTAVSAGDRNIVVELGSS